MRSERALWTTAVVVSLLPHLLVQMATRGIIGIDGYYHIRYAALLRSAARISIPFPWLPITILNPSQFTDHHLLFHLLLVPFTFGGLIACAKISAILFATAATIVWFAVARAQGTRYPLIWLLALLASSEAFLFRMAMTRRQSLTLLLLLLAVHLVLTRRWRWLIPLGFAFAWLYDGWPVLMTVVGIAWVARWLEHRRFDPFLLLAPFAGIALGVVINPFFPNSVIFPILHLLPKLALSSTYTTVRVGGEWYPYTLDALPRAAGVAVLLPFVGLAAAGWAYWHGGRRFDARIVAWGGCALLFLGLFLNSKRFVEMEPAFATMFAAVAWSGMLGTAPVRNLLDRVPPWLRPTWYLPAVFAVMLAAVSTLQAYRDTEKTDPPEKYARSATWLAQNTTPGERVFHTDWDDFPSLFFYDTRNVYMVGLDPNYMYQYDNELYLRWRSITRGEVDLPGAEIRDRFGSRWVFTDTGHLAFLRKARADPRMQQVYADREAVIFFVKPG